MNNTLLFHETVSKLRDFFFNQKQFVEVPAQSRLSILAACEDPQTLRKFTINNKEYPLPQTGQMWLERELLENEKFPGVFCNTTSYRDEPNPVPGRHLRVFPMFEFESKGGIDELISMEMDLLKHIGFTEKPVIVDYKEACQKYEVETLEGEHEEYLQRDFGNIVFLVKFNKASDPFWNMKQIDNDTFSKVDVILYGQETIGSAERSCDKKEMLNNFYSVSDGNYCKKLFEEFTEERVMHEMNDYLKLEFFERFGAGIGVSRMARALQLAGIIPDEI